MAELRESDLIPEIELTDEIPESELEAEPNHEAFPWEDPHDDRI